MYNQYIKATKVQGVKQLQFVLKGKGVYISQQMNMCFPLDTASCCFGGWWQVHQWYTLFLV